MRASSDRSGPYRGKRGRLSVVVVDGVVLKREKCGLCFRFAVTGLDALGRCKVCARQVAETAAATGGAPAQARLFA